MGTRGPVPERSEERRRTNEPEVPITTGPSLVQKVVAPAPHPDWHPLVVEFYESLKVSGQSAWYQPSDWMAAYVMCESLSRDLKPQFVGYQDTWNEDAGEMEHKPSMLSIPLKVGSLSAYLRLFSVLGVTEGDRRRISIELAKPGEAPGQLSPEELAVKGVADLRDKMLGR